MIPEAIGEHYEPPLRWRDDELRAELWEWQPRDYCPAHWPMFILGVYDDGETLLFSVDGDTDSVKPVFRPPVQELLKTIDAETRAEIVATMIRRRSNPQPANSPKALQAGTVTFSVSLPAPVARFEIDPSSLLAPFEAAVELRGRRRDRRHRRHRRHR